MTAVLNDISEGPALEPVQNQEQDRGPKQVQSLGELLRSKREKRGFSRQQAAEQLRLLPHWIEAFENNRFDSLVAPVYSRGYLRKYALLLELPPEEILERYEKLHDIPATPPLAPIKPTASTAIRTSRAPAWIGAIAFTAVGAALVISQMDGVPQGQNAAVNSQTQPVASTVSEPPPAPVVAAAQPEATAAEPGAPESSAAESTAGEAAVIQVSAPEASPPSTMETVTPQTPTLTPVSVELPQTLESSSGSSESEETTEASPPADPPLARLEVPVARNGRPLNLKLSFKGKSWATVYAADGTRLLYELGRRGRPRTISSAPPLTVIVGAIDAVEMRVNDKVIAIPREPGKDSIKFILDVQGGSREDTRSAADVGTGG